MKKYFSILFLGLIFISFSLKTDAQQYSPAATQNDSLFPKNIPALLLSSNGTVIQTKKDWEKIRRPELEQLLENEIYGFVPTADVKMTSAVIEQDDNALGGTAIESKLKLLSPVQAIKHYQLHC